MIFQRDIVIPAQVAGVDGTNIVMLPIAKGIITKMIVQPRPGHAALAHLVILHHESQIAPSNRDMDFHGDTFPILWEEYYESYQPPHELKLVGWNEDDTYPHTFTVFVVVLPRKAILAYQIVDALKGLFGMVSPKRISIPSWLGGKQEK